MKRKRKRKSVISGVTVAEIDGHRSIMFTFRGGKTRAIPMEREDIPTDGRPRRPAYVDVIP